ncbi:MAG: T9SS type A sorting domain-containing protein, partial [Vicingaceae bacterium]|nr:T9SS type A sorting domain-containing protein [Vicingaceae bacterium]
LVILEMGENDLNNASYQLIDMLGKQLKSQQMIQSKMNIDISGLKQGIYFLNVTNNNGRQVLKLIKN